MSVGLLGNKIGMTQIVDELGNLVPVTILRAGPCTVTQIKTAETDGYNAVQLGYAQVSSKILNKPQIGHLEKVGVPLLRYLHEYKVSDTNELTLGQNLGVDIFEAGNLVDVTGKSIGKGFAGLQKRHNFGRGPMTHGSAWLVECFEDGSNVHQTIFGTESKAELYADDWVLKNERTRISN